MIPAMRRLVAASLKAGLAAAFLVVAGCVTRPEPPSVSVAAPDGFPTRFYEESAARGESVYRVAGGDSVVHILVYRDGPLARLGHDHAVTARRIHGYAWWPDGGDGRSDLYLAIAELDVDDPDAREAAGFTSEPTAADIDGTRRNMLASLEADTYPHAWLKADLPPNGPFIGGAEFIASVELTLHGASRPLSVPVVLKATDDGFRVTGSFTVRQTEYGITPFSVFGGALSVRDELDLSFDLVFREY